MQFLNKNPFVLRWDRARAGVSNFWIMQFFFVEFSAGEIPQIPQGILLDSSILAGEIPYEISFWGLASEGAVAEEATTYRFQNLLSFHWEFLCLRILTICCRDPPAGFSYILSRSLTIWDFYFVWDSLSASGRPENLLFIEFSVEENSPVWSFCNKALYNFPFFVEFFWQEFSLFAGDSLNGFSWTSSVCFAFSITSVKVKI